MGHVWLVGMMGVGKTTVGALVAERLGLPLVDSDGMVMERTGRTIPDLFDDGEEVFRSAERAAIAEIASAADCVVSTGGGAVLDDANVAAMRSAGRVVLLRADLPELIDRIAGGKGRPLATAPSDIGVIAEARATRYREVADHTVDTSGRSPEEVADEVVAWLDT
jgi:shikimate kinase